jgi:hypothetical protein
MRPACRAFRKHRCRSEARWRLTSEWLPAPASRARDLRISVSDMEPLPSCSDCEGLLQPIMVTRFGLSAGPVQKQEAIRQKPQCHRCRTLTTGRVWTGGIKITIDVENINIVCGSAGKRLNRVDDYAVVAIDQQRNMPWLLEQRRGIATSPSSTTPQPAACGRLVNWTSR